MRYALSLLVLTILTQAYNAYAWEALVAEICPPLGVPTDLALAIIEHESGGKPYALGVTMPRSDGDGYVHEGYYPDDLFTATVLLTQAFTYTRNVGVGLMQITWAPDPYDLLDPATNIERGCTKLAETLSQSESIIQGIGRYHSYTPKLRDAYGEKIIAALAHLPID